MKSILHFSCTYLAKNYANTVCFLCILGYSFLRIFCFVNFTLRGTRVKWQKIIFDILKEEYK